MPYVLSRLNRIYVPIRSHGILLPYNENRGYADFKQLKETAMKAVKSATKSLKSLQQKVTSSDKAPLDLNKIKESGKAAMDTVSKSLQSLTQKGSSSGKGPIDFNKIKESATRAAGTVRKYLQPLTQKVTTSGRLDPKKIKESAVAAAGSISKSLQSLAQRAGIPKEKLDSMGSKLNDLVERTKPALESAAKSLKKNAKSLTKKVLKSAKKTTASDEKPKAKPKVEKFASPNKLLLHNPKSAYDANWNLIRSLVIYKIYSTEYIVGTNKRIIHIHQKIQAAKVLSYAMKLTFYRYLIDGEEKYNITRYKVLQRLKSCDVNDMLDHVVKDDLSSPKVEKLEKKAPTSSRTIIQHSNLFEFSAKSADGRYTVTKALTYFYINSKLKTHIHRHNQPGLVSRKGFSLGYYGHCSEGNTDKIVKSF